MRKTVPTLERYSRFGRRCELKRRLVIDVKLDRMTLKQWTRWDQSLSPLSIAF